MKVILKEDIPRLGIMGETVQVAPGYGRNYLIPQGKAVLATSKNFKELEHQRQLILRKAELIRKDAESFAEKLWKRTKSTVLSQSVRYPRPWKRRV